MKLAQAGNFAKVDVTNLDLMANFNLEIPKQEEPKSEEPKSEEPKQEVPKLPIVETGNEENNFYKDAFNKMKDHAGFVCTLLGLGKVVDPTKGGSFTFICFHSNALH